MPSDDLVRGAVLILVVMVASAVGFLLERLLHGRDVLAAVAGFFSVKLLIVLVLAGALIWFAVIYLVSLFAS